MNWLDVSIPLAILGAFVLIRRAGLISVKQAQEHLKHGALVIDVRSSGEFIAGHLPAAVNLPLSEIESHWQRRIKNKNQVLLLHCASGARSARAKKKIIALGCPNTYNMGSYARAVQIVNGK
jgi:phage shock protein E